jgi:methylated-DNA-[protein]-cysteine S-methyltransferase
MKHANDADEMGTRLVVDTPVGPLVLEGEENELTHLYLPNDPPLTPPPSGDTGRRVVERAADQLDEYFAGRRRTFDLALGPRGTEFQRSVWFGLADIPYGETISYAELAQWVGRPTAFRAVGQANGANPLPIVLPCHRVVASGGGIGGYGGGLDLKRSLLDLEQRALVH